MSRPVRYPEELRPGQRVRIVHTIRVGKRQWQAEIVGTVRDVKVLVTGLTTERAQDDIFAVPAVHIVKDNGELSSIVPGPLTRIEVLDDLPPS
ncbi:MAG: hypothetical protein C4297_10575 [Gemmataceae bacterium]